MIIENKIGYSYKDVTIVPSVTSKVMSRKNVNPFDVHGKLPIFTAPMSCVVNQNNCNLFENNNIYVVIPTTVYLETRINMLFTGDKFISFSISEAQQLVVNEESQSRFKEFETYRICIDCANGHMEYLLSICDQIKEFAAKHNCHIEIMTGNIANPNSYIEYNKHKIDYVRVGIGGGSGCITSSNTGVHYPMASLIDDICYVRSTIEVPYTKIIADGGIRNYSDVIKALALGADYVMIGGLFTECLEAASDEYSYDVKKDKFYQADVSVDKYNGYEQHKREYIKKHKLFHEVYGMSTKRVQKMRGNDTLKTSEGTQHYTEVKYTLKQWAENMESYIRSAMSYTNCFKLSQFQTYTKLIVNSANAINSVNK